MKALIDKSKIILLNRPYVYLTVASSIDGRISKGPNRTMWEDISDTRTSKVEDNSFNDDVDKQLKEIYKPQADMLGSNSLVKATDLLVKLPEFEGDSQALYQDFLPDEVLNLPDRQGWLLIVDGQGRIRSGWKGGNPPGWYMLHLVSSSVPSEYLAFLRNNGIPYLIAGNRQVDLKAMMEKLKSKLCITHLKTTAGGKLGGALLRAGLIDEINIVFSPYLIGGFETPELFASRDLGLNEPLVHLRLISTRVEDSGHIWVRYQVIHQG